MKTIQKPVKQQFSTQAWSTQAFLKGTLSLMREFKPSNYYRIEKYFIFLKDLRMTFFLKQLMNSRWFQFVQGMVLFLIIPSKLSLIIQTKIAIEN